MLENIQRHTPYSDVFKHNMILFFDTFFFTLSFVMTIYDLGHSALIYTYIYNPGFQLC